MAPTKVSPAGSSKTTKRPRKRPSKTTVKPAPANKKLSMDDLVAAPRVVSGQLVDVWEDDDEPTRGGRHKRQQMQQHLWPCLDNWRHRDSTG